MSKAKARGGRRDDDAIEDEEVKLRASDGSRHAEAAVLRRAAIGEE